MKNKKILIVIGTLLGLAVFGVILEKTDIINLRKNAPVPSQGSTAEQKQQESAANADAKKQLVEEQTKQNDTNPPYSTADKTIELTAKQETNSTVTVFTKLQEYSDGSCELTTTNGAKTNTQSASVIYQPEYSSCAGFSVPIDTIGKGMWTLKLVVTSAGTSENKTISLEVN